MDSNLLKKNKNQIFLTVLLGILFITACFLVYFVFKPYLWSAIIAGIFYVASRKIHKRLKEWLGLKLQWASPWIMVLVLLTMVVLPSIFIISTLINETVYLVYQIRLSFTEDKIIHTLIRFSSITDFITDSEFFWLKIPVIYREFVGKYIDILNLDSIYGILRNSSTSVLGSLDLPTGFIFNAFFSFLLLFFFYKEGKTVEKWIFQSLPFPKALEDKIGRRIESAVQTVMMGNLLVSLVQGAFLYIMLLISGISSPFLYASIGTFFSLIPVLGTGIIWIPIGLYLGFIEANWLLAIFFMVGSFSGYLILENYVKPKLLDRKLKIHPFLIFLSLIGGLKEFGLIGVIIGPVALTIIIILWDFWKLFRENALNFQDE
ncbi:AI-2E family transporter [Leptospira sp. GIMC2001]|uniref:AI-2E family transporter n=1 Tax=Leptospira sp. GIMC2001 TaxID=1513297 RepID=UPI00234B5962|nr:AI-2E family transporter [Leptospira sp. GIMC2001]WCL50953.1 AI-2E family transporter [Leptospira sp. GIMC2001]